MRCCGSQASAAVLDDELTLHSLHSLHSCESMNLLYAGRTSAIHASVAVIVDLEPLGAPATDQH